MRDGSVSSRGRKNEEGTAGEFETSVCGKSEGCVCVCVCVCMYVRRSRKAHLRVLPFGPPACKNSRGLTSDSEVSSRGNRRISAYVRVVVLGVLRLIVFGA